MAFTVYHGSVPGEISFKDHHMQRVQLRHFVSMFATALLLSSCGGSDQTKTAESADSALPPGHVPITPPEASDLLPVTQALLDSGNAAFRKQDFAGALSFYTKASEAQPGHAAPWFGTYMVGQATKNAALADSALRMVRERAPEAQVHPGGPGTGASPSSPSSPSAPYSPHQPGPPAGRAPSSGTSS